MSVNTFLFIGKGQYASIYFLQSFFAIIIRACAKTVPEGRVRGDRDQERKRSSRSIVPLRGTRPNR
jgi:hypothetical protein